jgi:hypothetical protein
MNRRLWIFALCVTVLVAIAGLASSLHEVQFEPARSFGGGPRSETPISLPQISIPDDTPIWKILLFWLAFVVNVVLFLVILPPELRKRILRQVISFAVGVLGIMLALRYHILKLPEVSLGTNTQPGGSIPPGLEGSSTPAFRPPQVAAWVVYIVSFALLWALFVLAWLALRWWRRLRSGPSATRDVIAAIARGSLADLTAGRQWGDVIIEAYARMTEAVGSRRGLHRAASTTPREFAGRLSSAGLPADSVAGLTRLFETVRYGRLQPGEVDRREAVACLESILRACGVPT